MEPRIVTLAQKKQQVQACDFARMAAVSRKCRFWQRVKGLQLLKVASERNSVFEADGDDGTELERLTRSLEVFPRCLLLRNEGVEVEKGDLGLGE